MARPRRETDLKALALNRHDLLMSKRNEIEEELKGLESYLKVIGRTGTKGKGKEKSTGQLPYEKRPVSNKARKTSATQAILSLIGGSEKGISINQIMNQTGLMRNTVNSVLNRMKKEGKVKAVERGVYVKQAQRQGQRKKAKAAPQKSTVPQKKIKPKAKLPTELNRAKKVSADDHRTVV